MNVLTIIPARAGSQRLPGKNYRQLGAISLIEHSIQYALANEDIAGDIVVSTNDLEIKRIAQNYPITVMDRPAALSSHTATTASVMQHCLSQMAQSYDWVVLFQPTNPLRPKNLFKDAFAKANQLNIDSLMTVSRSFHKLGKITDNKFEPYNYQMGQRSQDLEPLFFENGLLYMTKANFIERGTILGDNNYALPIDHPYAAVDIDEELDFKFAQFILTNYPNE